MPEGVEFPFPSLLFMKGALMDKSISQFAARQICKQTDSLALIVS